MGAYQDFVSVVREEIERQGLSIRSVALRGSLPVRSVHSTLTGHVPSIERAAEVADALGLEFYIGPPRDTLEDIKRSVLTPEERAAIPPEVDRALEEVVAERDAEMLREAAEGLDRVRRWIRAKAAAEAASRLPPADPAGEGEVIRFPASRLVDQIDLAVAAGSGAEAEDETVTERLTFRLDWLKSHGLDPSQCTVVKVQGESMDPTLPEGSAILVDRARRRRRSGGIFVVRTADGVVVKRAGKDEAGRWLLLSDHPAWKPAPWPDDAKVIGEVKWMARTL